MRLKELREIRGVTLYRVARDSGIAWSWLKKVEDGEAGLRFESAARVADALGVSLDELAGRQWPKAS